MSKELDKKNSKRNILFSSIDLAILFVSFVILVVLINVISSESYWKVIILCAILISGLLLFGAIKNFISAIQAMKSGNLFFDEINISRKLFEKISPSKIVKKEKDIE